MRRVSRGSKKKKEGCLWDRSEVPAKTNSASLSRPSQALSVVPCHILSRGLCVYFYFLIFLNPHLRMFIDLRERGVREKRGSVGSCTSPN